MSLPPIYDVPVKLVPQLDCELWIERLKSGPVLLELGDMPHFKCLVTYMSARRAQYGDLHPTCKTVTYVVAEGKEAKLLKIGLTGTPRKKYTKVTPEEVAA